MPKLRHDSGIVHIIVILFVALVTIGLAVYFWGGLDTDAIKEGIKKEATETLNQSDKSETSSTESMEEDETDDFKEGFIEGCISGDPENAKILVEAGIDVPLYCNCVYDGLTVDYSKGEILKMSLEVANGKRDDSFLYKYAEACLLNNAEE